MTETLKALLDEIRRLTFSGPGVSREISENWDRISKMIDDLKSDGEEK